MLQNIKLFLNETRLEFHRINWPDAKETVRLTTIVIGMSLGVAVFLGLFDALFSYGLSTVVLR